MEYLKKLTEFPIVVVARGTLSPKYLRWVRKHWSDEQIHVVNFSRWRYFDGVEESACRWVTEPLKGPAKVVVFDRSVTTGLTYRYLDKWFAGQGIETINLGELDAERSKFGIKWVDFIWEDDLVIPKDKWLETRQVSGEYTICVLGWRNEMAEFPRFPNPFVEGSFAQFAQAMEQLPAQGNVIIEGPTNIDIAMLEGYLLERPLITVSDNDDDSSPSDYETDESLEELVEFLRKEGVAGE